MDMGPGKVSINIDFNQTIDIDSPDFGTDEFGWWMCNEKSDPASTTVKEDYDPGTCIVNVAVMEYVHLMGEITSTQTVCLTTYNML
jgi:hypothetical protein